MKNNLYSILNKQTGSFRLKPGRKLSVFFICVFIASGFWLMTQLTKEYTISVYVPIKYSNLDRGQIVMNDLPNELLFSIKGDGYSLLTVNDGDEFDSLELNLSYLNFTRSGYQDVAAVSTLSFVSRLNRILGSKITVQNVSQDSIRVVLEKASEKVVPVDLFVEYQMGNDFVLKSGIEYTPERVRLIGPSSKLQKIESIPSVDTVLNEISNSVNLNLPLNLPDRVKSNTDFIEVNIEIEQSTETKFNIPISTKNVPDSIFLKTYPSEIEVTCKVGLSAFDKIYAHQFKIEVDYHEIIENKPARLSVNLVEFPEEIEVLSLSDERVEYIIQKRGNSVSTRFL